MKNKLFRAAASALLTLLLVVTLLPVQAHANEAFLLRKGLTNYWGYNTLAFFAPEPG